MDWLTNLAARLGSKWGANTAAGVLNQPIDPNEVTWPGESPITKGQVLREEFPSIWKSQVTDNPALNIMTKTLFWPNTIMKSMQGAAQPGEAGGWLGALKAIGTGEAPQITESYMNRTGTSPWWYGPASILESGVEAATMAPGLFKMGAEIAAKPSNVGQIVQEVAAIRNGGRLGGPIPAVNQSWMDRMMNEKQWYEVQRIKEALQTFRSRMAPPTGLLEEAPITYFHSGPGLNPKQAADLQGWLFKTKTRLNPEFRGTFSQGAMALARALGLDTNKITVTDFKSTQEEPYWGKVERYETGVSNVSFWGGPNKSKWARLIGQPGDFTTVDSATGKGVGIHEFSHIDLAEKQANEEMKVKYFAGEFGPVGSQLAIDRYNAHIHDVNFAATVERNRRRVREAAVTTTYINPRTGEDIGTISSRSAPIMRADGYLGPFQQGTIEAGKVAGIPRTLMVNEGKASDVKNALVPLHEMQIAGKEFVRGVYNPDIETLAIGNKTFGHDPLERTINNLLRKANVKTSLNGINFYYAKPDFVASPEGWHLHHGPRERKAIFAMSQERMWGERAGDSGPLDTTEIANYEKLRKALLARGMPGNTPFYPIVIDYKGTGSGGANYIISIAHSTLANPIYDERISIPRKMIDQPLGEDQRFKPITLAERKAKWFAEGLPPEAGAVIPEPPSKVELDLFGNPIQPPPAATPPTNERQLELDFGPEEGMKPRKFREAGIGKSFSNKIVYASHLGIGPEIQALANALDTKAAAMQQNAILQQELQKVFDAHTPWTDKAKELATNQPTPLKVKVFNLLENPSIDWESTEVKSLPMPIQNLMRTIYKEQMAFFWEENRIRVARGDDPYPMRHGYMMHILEAKVRDAIKRGMPVTGEILVPFGRKLNMNIFLSAAEQRTGANLEIVRDPVLTFIARRNLNDNYTILQPALDKAIEDFRTLQSSATPPPLSVARFFEEYVKTDVKGQIPPSDRALNASLAIPVKLINMLMSPFGRTLGPNAAKALGQKALGLQYLGTIWGVGRLFSQNVLQSIHQMGMYGPGPASKAVGRMINGTMYGVWEAMKNIFHPFESFQKGWLKSSIGKTTNQLSEIQNRFPAQDLEANARRLILKAGWMPLKSSDMLNVIHAGETAYIGAKNWQADAGFQAECRRLAIADGLPEDTYLWTDQDCINEANFGIMCAQYKYTPSASPELYRTVAGKLFGSLQSWTINYWGTFWRELMYRAYTGRTGWQTADGFHKPIPTKARAGAAMYLLSAAAVIGATSAMGFDYSKQFLFGTLPNRLSPAGTVLFGTGRYLVGLAQGNETMMKQGMYDMKKGGQAFIPAGSALRQLERAKTEGPGAFLFYYPKATKTVLPTRANIRRQVFKESGVPFPKKLTINQMLNIKP